MGKYKKVYTCDCCGSEFNEPSYNDPSMGVLTYKRIFNRESIGNAEITLGMNDDEIYLCNSCTIKFEKKLKEIGFNKLFEGCSAVRL
jgi:hypothetical protein